MSVQFGKCNFDGKPMDLGDLDKARALLVPYGPDGEGLICKDNCGILYRAFHTTKESYREVQPHISKYGFVLAWDGRLDNRKELVEEIGGEISLDSTDVEIVAAVYQRWGTTAFAKLIGDWALSVWNPKDQSLVLAKDFVGTRHLYYSIEGDEVTWCTLLDPLVLLAKRALKLEEDYIAGWLSFFPAAHLTPYIGIYSVPPSAFVLLTKRGRQVTKYWDFDPGKRIRYRSDAEYEEHFRLAFGRSVRRRLRSDSPILAELSGGMDSSSIVCMADCISTQGSEPCPRLDTVSFYDDSEPNWNERPYFTTIEARRGRSGCHIAAEPLRLLPWGMRTGAPALIPNCVPASDEVTRVLAECMESQGNRVVLSGVGGDEVTGGVPTPIPEIQDLLACGRFTTLRGQLRTWALSKRRPWVHLLLESVSAFCPIVWHSAKCSQLPSWLRPAFVRRHQCAMRGYESRVKLFGPLPSFQENISVLNLLRRQLACGFLPRKPNYEKRYPYLDRNFLEFLYAIPREQIVRPGQRRSLMRRSLRGIVPDEVLERRRKAYLSRGPASMISAEWPHLVSASRAMVSSSVGIVNREAFCEALQRAKEGQAVSIVPLMRTFDIEFWLQSHLSHSFPSPFDVEIGPHQSQNAWASSTSLKSSAS
ncbi:MAG TPA: asparagine synthase-related protein [Terriglobales bacterium]|nr:asparagine synthase-related protein [Terriglobales bacterium]